MRQIHIHIGPIGKSVLKGVKRALYQVHSLPRDIVRLIHVHSLSKALMSVWMTLFFSILAMFNVDIPSYIETGGLVCLYLGHVMEPFMCQHTKHDYLHAQVVLMTIVPTVLSMFALL